MPGVLESVVVGVKDLPFYGTFDLARQLAAKLAIINELDADWVIHADADELMESPREGETLRDGIAECEWVLFEESSHMPHIEERERYMEVVGSWLGQHD